MQRRILKSMIRPGVAIVFVAGLAAPVTAADATYRVVARTGQAAPGGGTFTTFGMPRINPAGRVAFRAARSGVLGPSGIWSEGLSGMNNLALAVRESDPIPGAAGSFFGPFEPDGGGLIMNALGETAFAAPIAGAQAVFGDSGIFVHETGGVDPIAMPGQLVSLPCAGFGCQRWFTDITLWQFAFNDIGQVAFNARFTGTGVGAGNDQALFLGTDSGVDVVLREGDQPPGTFGVTFSGSEWHLPHLNNLGDILIRNWLVDTNSGDAYWSAWRGAPGDIALVAAQGWTTPAGGEFDGGWIGGGAMGFNDAGQALFVQWAIDAMGESDLGLWLNEGFSTETMCFNGLPAPNGMSYGGPDAFTGSINAGGDIAFVAGLQGAGVNQSNDNILIRKPASGPAEALLREGDQVPGFLAGVHFRVLPWYGAHILDDGRVAFGSIIDGPGVHEGNDEAFWITRPGAAPALLIREGQTMVIGGQIRTVSNFSVAMSTGSESGLASGVSHLGQVGMRVQFADGAEAILVASPKSACPGDVNGDGVVDFNDLNTLVSVFGHQGDVVVGDLDLDGDVDFADLNNVLANFGAHCGS